MHLILVTHSSCVLERPRGHRIRAAEPLLPEEMRGPAPASPWPQQCPRLVRTEPALCMLLLEDFLCNRYCCITSIALRVSSTDARLNEASLL